MSSTVMAGTSDGLRTFIDGQLDDAINSDGWNLWWTSNIYRCLMMSSTVMAGTCGGLPTFIDGQLDVVINIDGWNYLWTSNIYRWSA
ncbi:hypothetical protein RRG08_034008 [Elysia crispata]|uniref:Uncharacterized protein n=1 Tax=Elysia crispata TaxID=231223 RepID=A0AAE1CKN2_9GAST|nr:hypothetical protein RRG08_034008 [Elysia crispata]